jgi:hypothetical protein
MGTETMPSKRRERLQIASLSRGAGGIGTTKDIRRRRAHEAIRC